MKKVFLSLGVIAMCSQVLFAHPPKDIKISFDQEKKILSVSALHDVKDPLNHFIKNIDVTLNDNKIITQICAQQTNNKEQSVMYVVIDAKKGDTIAVRAECSKFGDLTKMLAV